MTAVGSPASAPSRRPRPLVLDDEQLLLRDAARALVAECAPLADLRNRRAAGDDVGFDRALHRRLVELGWLGITLPVDQGGSGGRLADTAVLFEVLGANLAPTPLLSSELLAGRLLAIAGGPTQQSAWLPAVCGGQAILALAFEDRHHHDRSSPSTTATRRSGGYVLQGAKREVIDGHVADQLVVIARSSSGCSAFLVNPTSPGVTIRRNHLIDHRISADISLDGVVVDDDALVGEEGAIDAVLDGVLDRATVALCAEMLGSAQAIFDRTVAYLRDRVQFDQPIGSFQALQHRAAIWHCDLELARSLVMAAVAAVDDEDPEAGAFASAAKATMSDLLLRSGAEAIQLHGGIGMTYEADPGLFVPRARVAAALLGDATFHRRRFATLNGC